MTASDPQTASRYGIDLVEIARVRRLVDELPREDLLRVFSERELGDAAAGLEPARLAARFAAKEACLKLFPRETALGEIVPGDFEIVSDGYGAPQVICTANAADVLARHWLEDIALSLSHDGSHATAVAVARPRRLDAPAAGKFMYHCVPIRRRVVMSNLRRAFGASLDDHQIVTLAQGFYAHLLRSLSEFARVNLTPRLAASRRCGLKMSRRYSRRTRWVRECWCCRGTSVIGKSHCRRRSRAFRNIVDNSTSCAARCVRVCSIGW